MPGRFSRQFVGASLKWAPAVANINAPTRAEITAASPIIAQFRESAGLTSEQNFIETPDYVAAFTPKIPGRQTTGNPTLTFYDLDETTHPTRITMVEGTVGFLMRFPHGDEPGYRMEVWPGQLGAVNDSDWGTADEPALFSVALAPTAAPDKSIVIPA